MDKMYDNKGTPTKKTSLKNASNDDNTKRSDSPEIEQQNSSNATPTIPDEMPIRESK